MLNGRTLNILNSESVPDLVPTDTLPQYDFAVDKLLSSHSNLLKDFQVISVISVFIYLKLKSNTFRNNKLFIQTINIRYIVLYVDIILQKKICLGQHERQNLFSMYIKTIYFLIPWKKENIVLKI